MICHPTSNPKLFGLRMGRMDTRDKTGTTDRLGTRDRMGMKAILDMTDNLDSLGRKDTTDNVSYGSKASLQPLSKPSAQSPNK